MKCDIYIQPYLHPAELAAWSHFSHFIISGEKPFLCDKCGRGFNRVDNLRSHVKTVHQGKAGINLLVVAERADEEDEECVGATTADDIKIVTVSTEDIVTLATETLAANAVGQLTGQTTSASSDF